MENDNVYMFINLINKGCITFVIIEFVNVICKYKAQTI